MILITGASSGFGEATARRLAKDGYSLFLVARRLDRLKSLQTEIQGKHPSIEVHVAGLDVCDSDQLDRFQRDHQEAIQKITVLVNNAGLAAGADPFQTAKFSDWDQMIETNIRGLLRMTRAILPVFLKRGSGHIINMGSVAGQITYPNGSVYCATKAAVKALNEAMRLDLIGKGIRVSEIAPGMAETEFSLVRLKDAEKAKKVYAGMTPLTADDVAETIAWVISRPPHVNIQQITLYPTEQASPTVVHRRSV